MNKLRIFAAILVFGSFWGFSEVIIGSYIESLGLPSGAIMSGLFALTVLLSSRLIFKKPGMQLGIGIVAGFLRIFNPFMGCHLCSAIAIMGEGALFEVIFYKISFEEDYLKKLHMQASIGIITAYVLFVGGYIITQILTPILAGATFYLQNLIVLMPKILANALLPAVLGGIISPGVASVKKLNLRLEDRLYYPITAAITIFCWFIVIRNFLMV